MRRFIAGICAATAAVLAMACEPARAGTIYCTQGPGDVWSLQKFKPLIKVEGGTVFAEITFAGSSVQTVKVRTFFADWVLGFEYKFDASGRLTGLVGSVLVNDPILRLEGDTGPPVTTQWLAEADLTPGPDGKIPAHHTKYSRENDKIDKPENADQYIDRFNAAPVYRTLQDAPCSSMMKEAEKMNAEQG